MAVILLIVYAVIITALWLCAFIAANQAGTEKTLNQHHYTNILLESTELLLDSQDQVRALKLSVKSLEEVIALREKDLDTSHALLGLRDNELAESRALMSKTAKALISATNQVSWYEQAFADLKKTPPLALVASSPFPAVNDLLQSDVFKEAYHAKN